MLSGNIDSFPNVWIVLIQFYDRISKLKVCRPTSRLAWELIKAGIVRGGTSNKTVPWPDTHYWHELVLITLSRITYPLKAHFSSYEDLYKCEPDPSSIREGSVWLSGFGHSVIGNPRVSGVMSLELMSKLGHWKPEKAQNCLQWEFMPNPY